MNEIVIEDKKYISSKRAAEITGYAKDYVGQLCREGRIEARLIGRNWYVLEAAIEDHRFGVEKQPESVPEEKKDKQISRFSPDTWEAPRYETTHADELPAINRLTRPVSIPEEPKPLTDMQEAWGSWFQASQEVPESEDISIPAEIVIEEEPIEIEIHREIESGDVVGEEIISEDAPVAINYIHAPALISPAEFQPVELPPLIREESIEGEEIEEKPVRTRNYMLPRFAAMLLASVALVIFAVNSGYLDPYIAKYSQASAIAGMSVYQK